VTGTAAKVVVKDDRGKLAFMRRNVHAAARMPSVVTLASRIVRPFRPDDWRTQVTELHRFVRDGVRYETDPDRREQLADPRASVVRGFGDCDDKASALCALGRALGLDCDIWPIWKGTNDDGTPRLGHVQAAFRWPGTERMRNAHDGGEVLDGPPGAGWLIADPTVRGAEVGANPLELPRNPDTGKLPLA
jgi:transglutaminase-like putative cysteine protease